MALIRKIAFTLACSGLVVAPTMANARSTSGGVPAFSVSTVGQNSANREGGGNRGVGSRYVRGGKWIWIAGIGLALVVGGVIIATASR